MQLLAPNPLFPIQRQHGQFKTFSVTVTHTTPKQTLNCPIEHFEEEGFRVKHQKFYQINKSHPSLFHKTVLTPIFQHLTFK